MGSARVEKGGPHILGLVVKGLLARRETSLPVKLSWRSEPGHRRSLLQIGLTEQREDYGPSARLPDEDI